MLKDNQTLTEAKITSNAKIILMASKLEEITSVATAGSSSSRAPKKDALVAVVSTPLCDLTEHKKHVEKIPEDVDEGILNKRVS